MRVPKDDLVGPLHDGWRVMLSNLELERILLSAGYVGAAQSTLDLTVEYAKTRTQFDRPIGTFQSLAHVIADLQTDVDSARLLTYRAAWLRAPGRAVPPGGGDGEAQGIGDLRGGGALGHADPRRARLRAPRA